MFGLEDAISSGYKFYNGEETLFFDADSHIYYKLDGRDKVLVPGVTSIIEALDKPALIPWAVSQTAGYIQQNWASFGSAATGCVGFGMDSPIRVYSKSDIDRLVTLAKQQYKDVKLEAADIGSMAHDWLDRYLKEKLRGVRVPDIQRPDHPRANHAIDAALGWLCKHEFRPIFCERKVYSRSFNYAGTADKYGEMIGCGEPKCCGFSGKANILGDFKTSGRIYDTYRLQLAAYRQALREETGASVDKCIVLRIDKDGDGFKTLVIHEHEFDLDWFGFLGALHVYQWERELVYNRAMGRKATRLAKLAAEAEEKARKARERADKKAEKAKLALEKAKEREAKRLESKRPRRVVVEKLDEIKLIEEAA